MFHLDARLNSKLLSESSSNCSLILRGRHKRIFVEIYCHVTLFNRDKKTINLTPALHTHKQTQTHTHTHTNIDYISNSK